MSEPWHCKHKGKSNYCKKDHKYCNPINAFGLTCYERIDVIEKEEDNNGRKECNSRI